MDLNALVREVARHTDGIGIERLLEVLGPKVTRRTLQRRLAELVTTEQLVAVGSARARRYRASPRDFRYEIAPPSAAAQFRVEQPSPGETDIPLSEEDRAIRAAIRQPLRMRRPVTYEIAFLEAYEPNHTAYLPTSLREQLHAIGRSTMDAAAPAGTFARDILNRLLIDLSWASSRLEGNTYSRLDTARLIEHGRAADGKDAVETQMILNHKAAIEYLVRDPDVAVDVPTILSLHALLSDGLLHDPASGGRVRRRAVDISGSVYRPLSLPQPLEELFTIVVRTAAEITDPFEQAFFLMVHLPYLQPFEDVNKRTSRLAANIPLARANLAPLSFVDVPTQAYVDGLLGIYELTKVDLLRDVFVRAYERSCQEYNAVRRDLVPPDLFRLRHRAQLGVAMKAIVQRGLHPGDRSFTTVIPADVAREERQRFEALLRTELSTLHAGNAVRFGLRGLEVEAWQGRGTAPPNRSASKAAAKPRSRALPRKRSASMR